MVFFAARVSLRYLAREALKLQLRNKKSSPTIGIDFYIVNPTQTCINLLSLAKVVGMYVKL